jgi:hypothetical protein
MGWYAIVELFELWLRIFGACILTITCFLGIVLIYKFMISK